MVGAYIAYKDINFKQPTLDVIEHANHIIQQYQAQGYTLTLRQLHYQFVARGLRPNTQRAYSSLGDIISDARMTGLVDWEAIEDRGRFLRQYPTWEYPHDLLDQAAIQYKVDMWANQEFYPEVWIEKDALVGVIEGICNRYRVPHFSCRGYNSMSSAWRAGQRFWQAHDEGRHPVVFHLGDHDPSGLNMTEDNESRLETFSGCEVEVIRLALNMPQVEQHRPPPNPTKTTDSRSTGYIRRFGRESWELDALEPSLLTDLIDSAVQELLDLDVWEVDAQREREGREAIADVAAQVREREEDL